MPRVLTNQERLEALATRPLPSPFDAHIGAMRDLSAELRQAAHAFGIRRKFTLDGRLLGDLGEVIARLHFGMELHDAQQGGEDGRCEVSGKSVELKLRSAASLVYVKKIPDILVAVYLSPISLRWGVVCNGPGSLLLADAKWHEGEGRFSTNLQRLLRAQEALPVERLCLAERGGANLSATPS